MANLKSSQKDVRRIQRRNARNVSIRSRLKTLSKKVAGATGDNSTNFNSAAVAYESALDKAVKRGIIHSNKAARQKARMAKMKK